MNNDCYGSALHIFTINQSIILFSDAGYKSDSHEADVDLQLKGFSFIGLLRWFFALFDKSLSLACYVNISLLGFSFIRIQDIYLVRF